MFGSHDVTIHDLAFQHEAVLLEWRHGMRNMRGDEMPLVSLRCYDSSLAMAQSLKTHTRSPSKVMILFYLRYRIVCMVQVETR